MNSKRLKMKGLMMTAIIFLLRRCCIHFVLLAPFALNAYSIVYVHIGPSLPEHLFSTIAQARLFNAECPIYLIANQHAIEEAGRQIDAATDTQTHSDPKCGFKANDITYIACESLSPSAIHEKFHANQQHDWGANGFWVYTSERFFFLDEFVRQYDLTDVFHFENDILLYVNLQELLPVFHKHYPGMIATTFENDDRCVPGFLYIANSRPLNALIQSFPAYVNLDNTDMETIARFKNQYHKVFIDYLPIIIPEYVNDHVLCSFDEQSKQISKTPAQPELFFNHFEDFSSVFDAAALGVYLGGMNAAFHEDSKPGKIDVYCVFNPSYLNFDWQLNAQGQRIPFITYKGHRVRINNLHITNKQKIPLFSSFLPCQPNAL